MSCQGGEGSALREPVGQLRAGALPQAVRLPVRGGPAAAAPGPQGRRQGELTAS